MNSESKIVSRPAEPGTDAGTENSFNTPIEFCEKKLNAEKLHGCNFSAAPMATLSHEAFRRCVEKFGGCNEYFTEMINASSLVNMGPFEKFYLLNGPCPEKIVWQLTGSNNKNFAKAVDIIAPLGGIGIDLNMGCSAPQIYKTGAGIAWMLKPLEETKELIRCVKNELPKNMRLSVKCRLGEENKNSPAGFNEDNFFAFTDMLVENGVELITLHPRTMKEKYRLTPKYQYVQKLCNRYNGKIKIGLNGAIKDKASLEHALSIAPDSDSVMIARELAVRPWIFAELNGKAFEIDREQLALDFIDDVEQYQPKEFHRTRIQRFFSYYCQQFKFGHYFANQMLNYKDLEESRKSVEDYFSKQPEEKVLKINQYESIPLRTE